MNWKTFYFVGEQELEKQQCYKLLIINMFTQNLLKMLKIGICIKIKK